MKKTAVGPTAIKQAGVKATDMSTRIRAISGKAQARASNDQLTGTSLGATAKRTVNTLAKTCIILTNRLDQHAEASIRAIKAFEGRDANAAQYLRKARVDHYDHTIEQRVEMATD